MGNVVVNQATGIGTQTLGGLQQVTEVAAKVNALATEAGVSGSSPVRRVHKQAWYALGFTPDGGPFAGLPVITWHKFVEVECEDTLAIGNPLVQADTLYWEVFSGGECTFEVDWV